MIAMLIGCGLRRGELLALRLDSIQVLQEHLGIADLRVRPGISVVFRSHMGKACSRSMQRSRSHRRRRTRSLDQQDWPCVGNGMAPKVQWALSEPRPRV